MSTILPEWHDEHEYALSAAKLRDLVWLCTYAYNEVETLQQRCNGLEQTLRRMDSKVIGLERWVAAKRQRDIHVARGDFSDWVKQWSWKQANGYCMNPHCRTELLLNMRRGALESPRYDHIVPRNCGGLSTIVNIQLICNECNMKKGGCRPGRHNHQDYRPEAIRCRAREEALRQTQRQDGEPERRQLRLLPSDDAA